MIGFLDVIWKMLRYNLKIVFGNKFIYFLLGAVVFFLFITTINIFEDERPSGETVYYILLFPGLLLMFYPSAYGIQNDEDVRVLEILFGIPNYRYKVWLVRLIMILLITSLVLFPLAYLSNVAIYPIEVGRMVSNIMFPIFFLACLSFMMSTIVRNGNGTAVVMIIICVGFWISAAILEESPWNIFLNPFAPPPNEMNEVVWEGVIFRNRVGLFCATVVAFMVALVNMRKRERFV